MKLLRRPQTIVVALLLAGACVFGSEGERNAEDAALVQTTLGVLAANSRIQLLLRSGDGGLDSIQSFAVGPRTVTLSTLQLHIYRAEVDLVALSQRQPDFARRALTALRVRLGAGALYAHDEGPATAGAPKLDRSMDMTVNALSPSVSGAQSDLGGRRFNPADPIELSGAAALGSAVRLHVDRLTVAGTIDGTPFAIGSNTDFDLRTSLTCRPRITPGTTAQTKLFLNFSRLFTGLSAASQAAAESAVNSNLGSSTLLEQNECFQF